MSNEAGSIRAIASVIVSLPDKTFSRLGGKMAVIKILMSAAEKLEKNESKD